MIVTMYTVQFLFKTGKILFDTLDSGCSTKDMETTIERADSVQNSIISKAFAWMFGGLLITALTSFVVASSPSLVSLIFGNLFVFYGLLLAELVLVFFLSARAHSLSSETAGAVFFVYSFMNGLTLSVIFLAFAIPSIFSAFITSAGVFGLMALYGSTTKKDLTAVGSLAFMALIGLILASIVNIFLQSSATEFVLSIIGVLVFTALTAYDTQKLKNLAHEHANVPANAAILGALTLYLDFINLFLYILRLFGRRRN